MELISEKVLHYGRFKETLCKIVDLMQSEYPSSVIIRGDPGSGKKTIVDEALKLTGVDSVIISPELYSDDYIVIKAIATQLGCRVKGSTISDLMNDIRNYSKNGNKLVIVLEDFDDFCSQRQSLLYNLMNLIHTNPIKVDKGPNLTLIGLTCNLEWAENIEKRVRSRLNAKCIDLKMPYSNLNEYVEFASLLMNGQKIQDELLEQITYMYWLSSRSIRTLKKYLLKICDIDDNDQLIVNFKPNDYIHDYQIVHNNLLRERVKFLNQAQLNILKLAVYYCYISKSNKFTISTLLASPITMHYRRLIDPEDVRLLSHVNLLLQLRLLKPDKPEQVLGFEAVMYPALTSTQFKAIMMGEKAFHDWRADDDLWKKLK